MTTHETDYTMTERAMELYNARYDNHLYTACETVLKFDLEHKYGASGVNKAMIVLSEAAIYLCGETSRKGAYLKALSLIRNCEYASANIMIWLVHFIREGDSGMFAADFWKTYKPQNKRKSKVTRSNA